MQVHQRAIWLLSQQFYSCH